MKKRRTAVRPPRGIGELKERSLHAAVKKWYAVPTDRLEARVGSYVADIERDGILVEIQTRSFGAIRRKLRDLLVANRVRLVHPVAKRKWIVRVSKKGKELSRRRSPKEGKPADIFTELVSIPDLARHPNFSLDVLMTEEEELRCDDGRGSWRRGGVSVVDHRLVSVINRVELHGPEDYARFLPAGLPSPFTNRDLAAAAGVGIALARRMTYCLKRIGTIREAGRRGLQLLFEK